MSWLPRVHAIAGPGLVVLGLVIALAWVSSPAGAHNPAETIFHPVPIEEELLALGGEGTWALLDAEGTPQARGNISGDGEVMAAPVTHGDTAAAIVTAYPDVVPNVQAIGPEGPSWRVDVGEADTRAFLTTSKEGFAAFSSQGRLTVLTTDGDIVTERELDARPLTRPAPAPGGGWYVATSNELVHLVDGEAAKRASFEGRPTDVTVREDAVLLSLAHRNEGRGTLMVFNTELELDWSRSIGGLRLGGSPAMLEQTVVVATYDPEGARLVGLEGPRGNITFDQRVANTTALAPAAHEESIFASSTSGLLAFDGQGTLQWAQPSRPYLASPVVLDQTVVASSADNELVALGLDGTVAWRFTDGVDLPSWSHHGGSSDGAVEPTPFVEATAIVLMAAVLAGVSSSWLRPRS